MSRTVVTIVVAFLLASAMLLTVTPVQASDTVFAEYSVHPEVVKPGTKGYIQIKLTNVGTQPVYDLYLFSVRADEPLKVYETNRELGSLYPGKVKYVILKFEVPGGADPGFYIVKVFVRAKLLNYTDSFEFDVPIEVKRETHVKLSVTPEEVQSDSTTNLTLVVGSVGGEMRDVRISWKSDKILPFAESSSIFVPSVEPGSPAEVKLQVKTTDPGTAVIVFNVSYTDPTGNTVSETRTIALKVKSREEPFLKITLEQEALEVGKPGKLTFTVTNEGGRELRNIFIDWQSNDILPASSSSEFIKLLEPGDSKMISFDVFVNENLKPGYYTIPLTVRFDSSGKTEVVNRTFAVMVRGDISLTTTLFRAESNKVFVSIANTGNAPAKNLVVYARSSYGRAEVFIGDLDPGDEEIVEVDQKGVDTTKPYNLTLKLEYRDVFGNKFVDEKVINVHHFREPFPTSTVVGASVVIVLVVAGVWLWRRT